MLGRRDGKSSVGVEGVIFKLSLSRACQRGHHYLAFYHIVVELRATQLETHRGKERQREGVEGCRMQLLYEGIKKTIRGARKLRCERA